MRQRIVPAAHGAVALRGAVRRQARHVFEQAPEVVHGALDLAATLIVVLGLDASQRRAELMHAIFISAHRQAVEGLQFGCLDVVAEPFVMPESYGALVNLPVVRNEYSRFAD